MPHCHLWAGNKSRAFSGRAVGSSSSELPRWCCRGGFSPKAMGWWSCKGMALKGYSFFFFSFFFNFWFPLKVQTRESLQIVSKVIKLMLRSIHLESPCFIFWSQISRHKHLLILYKVREMQVNITLLPYFCSPATQSQRCSRKTTPSVAHFISVTEQQRDAQNKACIRTVGRFEFLKLNFSLPLLLSLMIQEFSVRNMPIILGNCLSPVHPVAR